LKDLKCGVGQGWRTDHVEKLRIITKGQRGKKNSRYNKTKEC